MMTHPARHLRLRADAAHRLPGGDPWLHRDNPAPTARQLEAWCHAAKHVAADGVTPVLPVEVLRALYRHGGEQRELAERINRAGGVAA